MRALILTFALAACATPQPAASPAASAAPVIAAERAFAARAHEIGWIPAFCETTADSGQLVGRAGLVPSKARMCALPDDGNRDLYWDPAYVGMARSGDLAFTTGAASFDAERTPAIQYFTVWQRQPDGSWRWIYDGGVGPVESPGPYLAADAPVPALPAAEAGVGSASDASSQVEAIERRAAASADLSMYLAANAHVYRRGHARAYGGAASQDEFASQGAATFTLRRIEASSAGDLVFTLGEAHWSQDGTPAQGFFARIWQKQTSGWRIVYDQIVPWTPPPAAN